MATQNITMTITEIPREEHKEQEFDTLAHEEREYAEHWERRNALVGTWKPLKPCGRSDGVNFIKYTEVRDMGGCREANGTCCEENSARILELWEKAKDPNTLTLVCGLMDCRLYGTDDAISHIYIKYDPDYNPEDDKYVSPRAAFIDVSNGSIKYVNYNNWFEEEIIVADYYLTYKKFTEEFANVKSILITDTGERLKPTKQKVCECIMFEKMVELEKYYEEEFCVEEPEIVHLLHECYLLTQRPTIQRIRDVRKLMVDTMGEKPCLAEFIWTKICPRMFDTNRDKLQKGYEKFRVALQEAE